MPVGLLLSASFMSRYATCTTFKACEWCSVHVLHTYLTEANPALVRGRSESFILPRSVAQALVLLSKQIGKVSPKAATLFRREMGVMKKATHVRDPPNPRDMSYSSAL